MHPGQTRRFINACLTDGRVRFSPHAKKELAKDGLDETHAYQVLKRGRIQQPEWEKGEYRYRLNAELEEEQGSVWLVVAFEVEAGDPETIVVTGWRKT